jgi:hypothetical protein
MVYITSPLIKTADHMSKSTDNNHCPLCQQSNFCEVNSPTGCWCTTKKIPTRLIAQIEKEQQGKACICQSCVDKFNLALNRITDAS